LTKITKIWSLIIISLILLVFSTNFSFAADCWDHGDKTNCEAETDSNCNWRDDAWGEGWCEELDCWSFYSENNCLDANSTYSIPCSWQTSTSISSGWCTETSCYNFDGTNQTACETDSEDYGLDCTWSPTDSSSNSSGFFCYGGFQCNEAGIANNEGACRNTTGCIWGSCYAAGCWGKSTQTTCNEDDDCYWDTTSNSCYEVNCWDSKHSTEAGCENSTDTLNCDWNSQYNYCQELNCWSFNDNQTGCENTNVDGLECLWNNPWCETKSCWENDDEGSCLGSIGYDGKNCTWEISSFGSNGWCERVGCWNYDEWHGGNEALCENNTFGLDCSWENNTWGGVCYQDVSALSCDNITDERKCFDTMWCWWDFAAKSCNEPYSGSEGGAIGGAFDAPDCWIFDLNQSSCTNTTGCLYNSADKLCDIDTNSPFAADIENTGLNCSLLNNTNLCNAATFLPYCCEWQGSGCSQNKYSTSCWDNIESPPEGGAYCEDYNAYTSKSICNRIGNHPWYMPCRWNNGSKHCEFVNEKFFSGGDDGDIDLVDNKDMCERGVGGLWITESYCGKGNLTNASITAGRCASKQGSQGGNCDTACYRCEFTSAGRNYSTLVEAQDACENSGLGFCVFNTDASAPNGRGYCEPSEEFKQGGVNKCDENNCAGCNSYNPVNAKTKCQEARCEWKVDPLDPTQGFCASESTTTCLDRCADCKEQKVCVEKGRGVNGSCTWDSSYGICKKSSSGENTGAEEICFDAIDNDGDKLIDCADGACFADPYCGGTSVQDCWQYSNNDSCTTNNCLWRNDTYGSWCDQPSSICWENDGDSASCNQQSACEWHPAPEGSAHCDMNESVWDECGVLNQSTCNGNNRCYWFVDSYYGDSNFGWCGHRYEICWQNQTLGQSQSACEGANDTIGNVSCTWQYDPWAPSGGFCEVGCFGLGNDCSTDSMCESSDGWCDPVGFGGNGSESFGCFSFEDETACTAEQNCNWFADHSEFCDVSYNTDCYQFGDQSSCNVNNNCSWFGNSGPGGWCDQKSNICWGNYTLSSNQTECDSHPLCFWKNWGGGFSACEPLVLNQTTQTSCASLNGTWRNGWCESASKVQMFSGMDMEIPPVPLGNDACPEAGVSGYSDICFFGLKDTKDNFGLGTGVANIRDAAMCNGISTFQGIGSGNNTAKFYWYVDSDGKSSGGCGLHSDTNSVGWDLHFRYEASYVNGSLTEQIRSQRCIGNEWKASNIRLSSWKQKMCNELQGGMVSINKDDLTAISGLLNLSATLRFYAATANKTANESSPSDTIGPAFFTHGSIDFVPECCWAIGDAGTDCDNDGLSPSNDPDCALLMNNGYIPFEDCFGNGIDEDVDGLTDCNDYDCKGHPYCVDNSLGVEAAGYVDTISPKIIFLNVERYSDSALLTFDTNEPANGTVEFYGNSSNCVKLNRTIYDVGIWNNDTPKFKNWHEVDLYDDSGVNSLDYDLTQNVTYYYKFQICDESGNCGKSACSNFSTAESQAKCKKCSFIFNMKLPARWIIDLDLDTDGVYETKLHRQCGASAGILLNHTAARSVNIRLRENSTNTTLFFLDARLTRSITHNEKIRDIKDSTGIKEGTTSTSDGSTIGYAGLSRDVANKLVDKLHPKSCMIQIARGSGSCDTLYHCDDELGNCVRRDTESGVSSNETGPDYCIWEMPCEFSTWSGGLPGSASSSSPSSGGGGGGGGSTGGGGGLTTSVAGTSASRLWAEIAAGSTTSMNINKEEISVTSVSFSTEIMLKNPELKVVSLTDGNPVSGTPSDASYQFLEIVAANMGSNVVSGITIDFSVPKTWLSDNNVNQEDVRLYRYVNNAWVELSTTLTGSDSDNALYQATTPGFSYFAIGGRVTKEETVPEPVVEETAKEETVEEVKPSETSEPAVNQEIVEKESTSFEIILAVIVILALLIGAVIWKIHSNKKIV
jgi:PGF-pre-PGF domain-containing protein